MAKRNNILRCSDAAFDMVAEYAKQRGVTMNAAATRFITDDTFRGCTSTPRLSAESMRFVKSYAKDKGITVDEAVNRIVKTAEGRLRALGAYQQKKTEAANGSY